MSDVVPPLEEGLYQDKNDNFFYVTNLQEVDGLVMFDLVESDDPEDMSAIATQLTLDEWPYTCKELSLRQID